MKIFFDDLNITPGIKAMAQTELSTDNHMDIATYRINWVDKKFPKVVLRYRGRRDQGHLDNIERKGYSLSI